MMYSSVYEKPTGATWISGGEANQFDNTIRLMIVLTVDRNRQRLEV